MGPFAFSQTSNVLFTLARRVEGVLLMQIGITVICILIVFDFVP